MVVRAGTYTDVQSHILKKKRITFVQTKASFFKILMNKTSDENYDLGYLK